MCCVSHLKSKPTQGQHLQGAQMCRVRYVRHSLHGFQFVPKSTFACYFLTTQELPLPERTLPAQQLFKVPDRLDGWEDSFEVPEQFSTSTMLALHNGQLNGSARREIVQAVASKIMNICRYPTTGQMNVVAAKIAHKLNVQDTLGTGHASICTCTYLAQDSFGITNIADIVYCPISL